MKYERSLITFFINTLGFSIGFILSFIDGIKIYYIGYSLLGGIFVFTILLDIFVSLPQSRRRTHPSVELSRYLAKSSDGTPPKFIKKIRERGLG